ncbi:MAG: ABC transporter substrate-binding protein [Myxococcota bacterium]
MTLLLALVLGCAEAPAPGAPASPAAPAPEAAPAPAREPETVVVVASTSPTEGLAPLRLGWQTTWATQGQLVAVLLHTDILARNGFAGELRGYPYGAPLNEGALAGQVDVVFTADQPALALAAKDPSWGIIGRLVYNRVGTVVPLASGAETPRDLARKTLAVPFGAAAQREAMEAIQAEGLDPTRDVKLVDRSAEEILGFVRAGARDGRWGDIDAAAVFDPTFAEIERSKRARTIASSVVTGVVMMDDDYLAAHPGADVRFRTALAEAWDVYRADPPRADRWFQQMAKLRFDVAALTAAAAVEPNLTAATSADIRVHLVPDDVAELRAAGTFLAKNDLLPAEVAPEKVVRPIATVPVAPVDTSKVAIR